MRLFQKVYDRWYQLTGGTQFGLARGSLLLAWLLLFGAMFYSIPGSNTGMLLFALYFIMLLCFVMWMPAKWFQSEIGWDPRKKDTSGEAFKGRAWGTLRLIVVTVAIAEFALAAFDRETPFLNVHLLYGALTTLLFCTLAFSACNRSETMPRITV